MIVDTSALLAFFDELEPKHQAVSEVITDSSLCIVSPYVMAELDYLVSSRYGRIAELAVLNELLNGDWELASMTYDQVSESCMIMSRHEQTIGLADASNLVLAKQYHVDSIATLDYRHFSYLHLPDAKPLRILP